MVRARNSIRLSAVLTSVDGEGGDSYSLAGSWEVVAVKEGAGPILDGVIVRDFWIPVSLAAVEGDTTADSHVAAGNSLTAAKEALFEVIYCWRNT